MNNRENDITAEVLLRRNQELRKKLDKANERAFFAEAQNTELRLTLNRQTESACL